MAKSNRATEIEPAFGSVPLDEMTAAGETPADEMARLREELAMAKSRNAELESILEERTAPSFEAQTSAPAAGPMHRWMVTLENAPTWIVEAVDSANAWDAYKRATGITGSQYTYKAAATNLPVGRVMPDGTVRPDKVSDAE